MIIIIDIQIIHNTMSDRKIWPNFFIVGAPKAGTTTLYAYLNATKGVYMSPVKEPKYFSKHKKPNPKKNRISNEVDYLKLFKKVKDEKAVGEASPSYLKNNESAELIHEKVPNARIIIMLRNPVQRAFSSYLMKKRNGKEKRTFHQIIEDSMQVHKRDGDKFDRTIYGGIYTDDVKRYMDTFGVQNVKILIFEEFIKDTSNQVKEILDFLGVNSELPSNVGKVFNAYGEPRGKIAGFMLSNQLVYKIGLKLFPENILLDLKKKLYLKNKEKPKISKEDSILLQKFYKEDVSNLEKLLGRKLPWK